MQTADKQRVPFVGNDDRNTSLTAGNSDRTTGSQRSWRNKPRLRAPWDNPDIVTIDDETNIHVVQPEHGVDETVLIDEEDLDKLDLPIRIQGGYAFNRGENSPVAHRVLGIKPDPTRRIVVDHANGNHLDNRKENLRILMFRDNVRNKGHYSLNHTGIIGLSKGTFKCKGCDIVYNRYVATVTDPNSPVDKKTGKAKRYTRAVSYGIHRTEAEAREIALDWLRKKQDELGYFKFQQVQGSTTIPGTGVGASVPK